MKLIFKLFAIALMLPVFASAETIVFNHVAVPFTDCTGHWDHEGTKPECYGGNTFTNYDYRHNGVPVTIYTAKDIDTKVENINKDFTQQIYLLKDENKALQKRIKALEDWQDKVNDNLDTLIDYKFTKNQIDGLKKLFKK